MPVPGVPFTDGELFDTMNWSLAPWALLALAPSWKGTKLVCGVAVAYFSLLYIGLTVSEVQSGGMDLSSFFSLDGIAALFRKREVVFVGWVHYVAFDLMVGWFEATDAAACGIPRVLVLPCLATTLMLGPAVKQWPSVVERASCNNDMATACAKREY
eukprot:gene24306-1554_t